MRLKILSPSVALLVVPGLALACAGDDTDDNAAEDGAPMETATIESASESDAGQTMTHLDPNDASSEDLAAIAGMTPEAVAAIEGGRPFARMADVHAALVSAIGEEAALATYESLWLPIDLNDATRDEILLIPGLGDRMAYEFEEYRPYSDMDQFRREIGKYVDETEVARLEKYVTLN